MWERRGRRLSCDQNFMDARCSDACEQKFLVPIASEDVNGAAWCVRKSPKCVFEEWVVIEHVIDVLGLIEKEATCDNERARALPLLEIFKERCCASLRLLRTATVKKKPASDEYSAPERHLDPRERRKGAGLRHRLSIVPPLEEEV